MAQSVWIPHTLPGMNEIIRAAKKPSWSDESYTKLKQSLLQELWLTILTAKLVRPSRPIRVVFNWYEPDKKRDIDNIRAGAKFIMDALVQAKVISDDGWACVVGMADTFSVDKDNPGVMVVLEEA